MESFESSARFPKNAYEFGLMFEQIKNWGRWGPNDQLGAANLITDETRRRALALAKLGRVVSLAHPILTEPAADNSTPFEQTMTLGLTAAVDCYKVFYHGFGHSHVDALCHIYYQGRSYNGYPAAEVGTTKGCTKLGIDKLKSGVLTRGILIDIPRLRNVAYLEPGTPVFIEDLEAWEKEAGLKTSVGDVILLRTGRWARRSNLGPWDMWGSEAGLHASVAPWLKARGVAFVGSDDALDVMPSLVEGVDTPVHTLAIAALGVGILDNQDLEGLAETAAQLKRWEFLLTFAPLPVPGGTGSPINALAIF